MSLILIGIFSYKVYSQDSGSSIITNERFNDISKMIEERIERNDIPSLSIAVSENGKIIWMESFGWADKENKIKASPNTLYSIASLSKPITATAIMKLYEQDKINLDENIDTYIAPLKFKYYCGDSIKVTCRHLLSHTAGLPMYFNNYYDDDTAVIPPVEQVIDKYGIIINKPSNRYSYANLGYGILGYIISRITKTDFEQYMMKEIFTPLRMTQATFDTDSRTKSRLAKRYDFNGKLLPFSFTDAPGAGNCNSTANDLIHFAMSHMSNRQDNRQKILSDSIITLMQSSKGSGTFYQSDDYGLGWFINDKNYKYKIVHHSGGMDGVDCTLKMIPEKDVAVVALMNQSAHNVEVAGKIADSVLTLLLPDIKEKKNTKMNNKEKGSSNVKEIKQSDLSGSWKGYIITTGEKIPIQLVFQQDGDIHVNTQAQFNTGKISRYPNQIIQHKMLLNPWFFSNGHFMGWYSENVPGEYISRSSGITLLDLEFDSGKLRGTAVSLASSPRIYYGISHYLELEREK